MEIEIAKPSEISQVVKLFSRRFGDNAFLYPVENSETVLIGKIEGKIIASGIIYRNRIHNFLPKIAIAVDSQHIRKRLGTKLHQSLLQKVTSPMDIGIDASSDSDNIEATEFIKSLGYKEYLETISIQVDLRLYQNLASSSSAKLMSEVALPSNISNEVKRFLLNRY